MIRTLTCGTALAVLLAAAIPASADTLLGSYIARLSDNDHYASDGYRLDTAAQVVRQDRANWHKFGRGDAEDDDDPWFGTADARARYETLLNKSGAIDQATRKAILNGEPVIEVQVYRNSVKVDILGY
jgi:hypothetical protein